MSLVTRLLALEQRRSGAYVTEAELVALVDAVARERDLPVEELLAETRTVLALTPAAREAYAAGEGDT